MVFPGKFRIRAQFFDDHTGSVGIWGCDARSALRGTKAFPRGEAFDGLHRTRAFRPFCLLRLPSLLWFAFGGYPTRPEICHRHISFSGSPHAVGNHPLRGRWPEGPDEVASNGRLSWTCPLISHGSAVPASLQGGAFGSLHRTKASLPSGRLC